MKTEVKSDIIDALKRVGLQRGDTVMVHTSLGKIGYVCGGAQAVIEALIETVGEEGTVMMSARSTQKSIPAWNTAPSWKMAGGSGSRMKHCL